MDAKVMIGTAESKEWVEVTYWNIESATVAPDETLYISFEDKEFSAEVIAAYRWRSIQVDRLTD